MNAATTVPNLQSLVSELFGAAQNPRRWSSVAWIAAFGLHAAAGAYALGHHVESGARTPEPLQVELSPPEPETLPPPTPEPTPTAPEPAVAPAHVAAAAPPPAAARAGALLTAKSDAPTPGDEPVDFTNDPSVAGFGAGVVAVGGKADFGAAGARVAPVHSAAPAPAASAAVGDGLTAAADLGRKPSLGESDPCRGYFPGAATDDVAQASVLVVVAKSGAVSSATVVSESPARQGFGPAARACLLAKHFTPALDRAGQPAATAVRVNIRFSR